MKIFGYNIEKQAKVKNEKKKYLDRTSFHSLFDENVVLDNSTFYSLYQKNGDIRQAVKKISENVARNGLYIVDNQWNIIDDNKLTDNIQNFFASPTFPKFKTELFKHYLVSGEVYIRPKKNVLGQNACFEVIDSRCVSKGINQQTGEIDYFDIYYSNGTKYDRFLPDEIAFFKLEDDVRCEYNGMGLLNGIVYDGLSDLEAMKNNYYFYQNSAIPSAILLLDDTLTQNEMQILRDQFDTQYRGSKNNHKTLMGGGIKDIKVLSMTPRDMEFINQRNLTTEKVSAVFGVPKTILGYTNNVNYSNGQTLRKEFIEGTIRPYEKDFEFMLNKCLQMFMPDIFQKYWVKADGDQFEQTQEEKQTQVEDIRHGIRTINEVRVERGYQKVNDENADKLLIRSDLGLLEDIVFNSVMPTNGQNNDTEGDKPNEEGKQDDKNSDEKVGGDKEEANGGRNSKTSDE